MTELSPAEEVFFAALERPSPAERTAYLDEACAGRPELRARVEKLLAAHPQVGGFLEPPAGEPTRAFGDLATTGTFRPPPSTEAEGTVIAGRYKLRQQIGEGGMGTVWMADQTEPVKRKVAVKLIRVERGQSKTILARFEAERQAIALMDHPHIAKLLDAGTSETGAPFFVMELVKGIPLNDFCDQHKLTIPERLTLFAQICSAVQHAHQKGIIHRDLKPGNILVESHDGKPVPKVIDFGLAKATTGLQLSEQSMFTAFGSVMGTPLYMAPEQASFNAVDVDTRADVYALGVILYELLTGTTPITRDSLKQAALDEMLRLVREQDAPTPSSRLSSAERAPSVAASRQTEPAKLGRFVKGELDWIVLKALAKDRDRRYDSATNFARDIERFLNHEPVQAGPPTARYRLRKFVRRNRGQVIAAGLVLLALVAGVVGTTLGLLEARRQTGFARDQEAEAVKQAGIAQANEGLAKTRLQEVESGKRKVEAEKKRADEEKQVAQAVSDFLQTKLLAQADTKVQADQLLQAGGLATEAKLNPTIRELLDRAAKELAPDKIEANFPNQPLVQAQILRTVGKAYLGVGEAATGLPYSTRSLELFRRHLGHDHPDTLRSMNDLAEGYWKAGQVDQAKQFFEESLTLRKVKFGPDHPETLHSMHGLAVVFLAASRRDEALALMKEAFKLAQAKLGPDHPDTIKMMNGFGGMYRHTGKPDQAVPFLEEALKRAQAKLGPDHPDTLYSMNNLAVAYHDARKLGKALPLLEQAFALQKAKLGSDHPDTLTSMSNLAMSYLSAGKRDQAIPLLEEELKLSQAKLGPDHPSTLLSMNNLATAYHAAEQRDKAQQLLEELLKIAQAKLGPDHIGMLRIVMYNLAESYRHTKKFEMALPLFGELLRRQTKLLGRDHPDTQRTLASFGLTYRDAGRLVEAIPLLEEAHRAAKANPSLRWVGKSLLDAYVKSGATVEAGKLIEELIADARQKHAEDSPALASEFVNFALSQLVLKQFAKAEKLSREAFVIREKLQPDIWTTFNAQSILGGALLGLKQYPDAEPLLVKGYEGMKAREKTISQSGGAELRIPQALDRLIELYTATNRPTDAAKWRIERAKYPTPKEAAPIPKEKK